jgi:MFS family permease
MQQSAINWKGVLFGLALSIFAAYQQLKLPPVLPILIETYGFGRTLAGGFISVYALLGLLLSLRLGAIMQRRGMTALLGVAFSLFAVAATIMMVWPQHGWLFLTARAMEGVAFAILAIAGPAICTANAGVRGLAIAAALIATWIPMGALIANLLTAALVEWAGWRSLWAIGLLATGAMALCTVAVLRDPRVRLGRPHHLDTAGTAAPVADGERLRWRTMALAAALFTLWSLQMFAYLTWLPDYLVQNHGHEPRMAALLFTVPMAVLTVFNLVAAPILRAGVPVALLFAMAVGVQTSFWLLLPWLDLVSAAIGGLFIYAAASGVAPTCLFALPATIFGVDRAGGRAFGALMTGRNLGVLCGPLLIGALIEYIGAWHAVPFVLGSIGFCTVAGALVLHTRLRRLDA